MRYVCLWVAMLAAVPAFGQSSDLTITNYRTVSEERRISATVVEYDYRVDVINRGEARNAVTATIAIPTAYVTVVQGTTRFANIPANGVSTSLTTITLRVDRAFPFDLNTLTWSFAAPLAPTANAGPNQTVAAMATVRRVCVSWQPASAKSPRSP